MLETSRNMKDRWDAIRLLINKRKNKNGSCPIKHSVLGTHFSQIAQKLNSCLPNVECEVLPSTRTSDKDMNFSFKNVDAHTIYTTINKLNANKGPGPDEIPAKILKATDIIIAPHLSILFNECLKEGVYPCNFKVSLCSPIFKGGDLDPDDPISYRPISILNAVNKVFERILHDQLMCYIENNDILPNFQFGYRKKHNTSQAVLTFAKEVENALDNKQSAIAIFMDLSKAFDTVDKDILNKKLAGGGKLKNLKVWWDIIQRDGPGYGYFPEPSKTWLITKPQFLEAAKKVFPDVNITDQGHKYLGSFIGTSEGTKSYVEKKIDKWRQDIEDLSHIAKNEPQLAYSAYTYGVSKRWMFLARTTPNIAEQMKKLEYYIRESLIPPIVGKEHIDDTSRKIFALPAKLGGLGINNPSDMSNIEYENSILATQQLTDAIVGQNTSLHIDEDEESKVKQTISKNKQDMFKSIREDLVKELSENQIKILDLASEKGASSWLTSLPLEKFGFVLNKQEFIDAMALRYNYKISNTAKTCACGQDFSVNHSLICKKGGYVALRHNTIRDTTAELLDEVCIDVVKEPMLLPVNGATLKKGSNLCDNARLDVSARGIWSPLARAFIDVRVFHPHAPSNSNKSIAQMYLSHERQKKNHYNSRVTEIERGTFSPIVFSTTGGMGKEAESFYKCIAMKLSIKRDQRYCETISFLRRRLRFDLLKTCIISLRGYRGQNNKSEPIRGLDYNLYRHSEF